MAKETAHTGGNMEFVYDKEADERIRSTDTESTKAFKEELEFKRKHPVKFWFKYNKKKAVLLAIFVITLVILYFKLNTF